MDGEIVRRAIRRFWWLLIAGASLGALATTWVASTSTNRAESTYVVRVAVDDRSDLVRATATLVGGDETVATYARIARSELIRDRARRPLDEAVRTTPVEVTSDQKSNTNIVVIRADSDDPRVAVAMAKNIGEATKNYVADLDDVFALTPLDPASLTQRTQQPPAAITAAGALLGSSIAFALATAFAARAASPRCIQARHAFDPISKAHNRRYLGQRFREERARSRDNGRPFSLGVLQVVRRRSLPANPEAASLSRGELEMITSISTAVLREFDVLGHTGDSRFAVIFPALGSRDAEPLTHEWRKRVLQALLQTRPGRDLTVITSLCECESSVCTGNPEAEILASEL